MILADFPTYYQIASLNKNSSLDQCRDLMNICNFINLLERTHYSQYSFLFGCSKCNPKENDAEDAKIPTDYISLLTGDILFPKSEKINYISKKVYKSIRKYPENKKILVLISSSYVEEVLKNLFIYIQQDRLGSLEHFAELALLKKANDIFKDVDNSQAILEKTVILEILYATYCMDMARVSQINPQSNLGLQKYIDYYQHYSEIFSYEALADPLEKQPIIEDDDKRDEDTIYVCPSHLLIYGDDKGKPLIKKFYLNPEYKKHFRGTEKEIEEIKNIYDTITEKTRKRDVIVEDNMEDTDKIKMKGNKGRIKKKKNKE